MSVIYRPRAMAHLTVPVMGTTTERLGQVSSARPIEFDVPVVRANLTKNDFNTADECELELDYSEAGFDPRLIGNATLALYINKAGSVSGADWQPAPKDLRFLGIVTKPTRKMSEDSPRRITLEALDYTTLFISMKPYPDDGAPKYTQSLRDAWATICDHVGFYDFAGGTGKITSSVGILRNRLFSVPANAGLENTILGTAVLDRLAKFGAIEIAREDDAWAVWRRCCDAIGLITWIYGDACYVSRAPDYYTGTDPDSTAAKGPPVMIWGYNITSVEETRDVASLNGKGIHLTSYDPISHQEIEAFFPPRDNPQFYKKRVAAKAKAGTPDLAPVSDYEHQNYPWATTKANLETAARRVWEERSRQELSGKLTTSELVVARASGESFDMLSLNHGDQFTVLLEDYALGQLRSYSTSDQRFRYLKSKGFADGPAQLIAADAGFLGRLLSTFVVKTVNVDFDADANKCDVSVEYLSRMNGATGSTDTPATRSFTLPTV